MTIRSSWLDPECHVLIVEDDPRSAADLREVLTRAGAGAVTAVRSTGAVAAAGDQQPDVVVVALDDEIERVEDPSRFLWKLKMA